MKKFFKKSMAVILALTLLFCVCPNAVFSVSAAAPSSYTSIALDEAKTVSVSTRTGKFFRFVPTRGGTYEICSYDESGDPYVYLLDAAGNEITYDDDSEDLNFSVSCRLEAGTTYYINACAYDSDTASYTFKISALSLDSAIPSGYTDIGVDEAQTVSVSTRTGRFFRFVPTRSGTYEICSYDESGDPYVYLLDAAGNEITYDDDAGEDLNFSVSCRLEAGTTYYINACAFSDSTASYTFKISALSLDLDSAIPSSYTDIGVDEAQTVSVSTRVGRYFRFVPTRSGTYEIYSYDRSGDPYVYLLDAEGNEITQDDDDGEDDRNFYVSCRLEAGTTYYINACAYGSSTASYTFKISADSLDPGSTPDVEPDTEADVWDGTIATGFGGGTGTVTSPYLIYTAEQLAYLASSVNGGTTYTNKYFKLMNNIDLDDRAWTPIGKGITTTETYATTNVFSGCFDGNGHIVYNLKISSSTTSFTGFFGCLYAATVKNLGIENADVTATGISSYRCTAGILAGASCNGSTIEACYTKGTLSVNGNSSFLDVGCLVGDFYDTDVTDSYAVATVSARTTYGGHVGGLFGYANEDTSVARSFFIGNISGSGADYCGAISSASSEQTTDYEDCYYSSNKSFSYATSLTATQCALQSSFANYDFTTVWTMGDAHPVLRGFEHSVVEPEPEEPEELVEDAHSEYNTATGDVFLGGKYIEIGINRIGSLGTSTAPESSDFHTGGSPLSLITDLDGWDIGAAPVTGDFFLPGSPEERYILAYYYNGTKYEYSVISNDGCSGTWREEPTVRDASAGTTLRAVVTGVTTHGVEIEIIYSFGVNDKFFTTEFYVTNSGSLPITDLRFVRNADPDQDQQTQGTYDTYNKVICNPTSAREGAEDNCAMVVARGESTGTPFYFVSFDNRARVSRAVEFDLSSAYKSGLWNETHSFANAPAAGALAYPGTGYTDEDKSITITFALGTLSAGESTNGMYFSGMTEVVTAPETHTHTYEWVVDVEATCGANGVKHEECTVCHTTRNEDTVIPATGAHIFEWVVDWYESCGMDGQKHEECIVCYATRNEGTVIDATGEHYYDNACDTDCDFCGTVRVIEHDYVWVVDTEATCGADGKKHEVCTVCYDLRSVDTVIPATGAHAYAWVVDQEATCGGNGQKHEECIVCYATRNEGTVIDATGEHYYDNTCDTDCNACGTVREVEHDYVWVVDEEATCGADGQKHEECTVCHATRNDDTVIDATGEHHYDNTCDTDCNICGTVRVIEHEYMWVVDEEATCGGSGKKHEECTVCHVTRNENTIISATGAHTYEWVVDEEATCGADGKRHEECTVCRATRSENTVISATGAHTFEWVVDQEVNCGVDGKKHEECTACHMTRRENTVIYATGAHTFEWVIDQEVNCGVDGRKHEECTVCHTTRRENTVIYATGVHTFAWVVDQEANCGADGKKHEECAVCHTTRNENTIVSATGIHTFEWVVDQEANCGTNGEKHEECTVCHMTRNENTVIPVTGDHIYNGICDTHCIVCGQFRDIDVCPGDVPHATFVVDSLAGKAGNTVTVAVRTERNPGITGLAINIQYDREVLELLSIEQQDFDGTFGASPVDKYPVRIVWVDVENKTDDGVVALLTFRIKEDVSLGETAVEITYTPEEVYDYDMNEVHFGVQNGTINVVDYMSGDLNGDGMVNNRDLGLLLRYLSDWDVDINTLAADVNGDGSVNNQDLGILLRYVSDWDIVLK